MNNVKEALNTLDKVTLVLYVDKSVGEGMCDENNKIPAQREYCCMIETLQGLKCAASIYAVDSKVLSYHPYAPSGCCSTCGTIDCVADGVIDCNYLLTYVMTRCVIRAATAEERKLCDSVEYLECGCSPIGMDNLLPFLNTTPSSLLN